ncbi:hypothetical protein ABW19_dt0202924 [Dactylella cylindrospora]|nr:hypothetical protein ABW19_dt0202924 [Dactylella cylindrospora]
MLRSTAMSNIFVFFATTLLFVAPVIAQQTSNRSPKLDPAENFCKRYQHQSAITDNALYIDGGTMWFHDDPIIWGPATQGINTYLIATDMSDSWDWKGNISQTSIYKTREPGRKSGYVPSLNAGAIWPNSNQSHLYFYGGTTNSSLSNFTLYAEPESDKETLWKYDVVKKFWDPVQYAIGSSRVTRASFGGSVVAPKLNKAYYLGGVVDRGSTDKTGNLQAPRFIDGMLEFDFETESVRNISSDGLGNRARAYSQMVYIPNYGTANATMGKKGILVSLGGEVKSSQIVDVSGNRRGDPVLMSDVAIYDIETEQWHVQQASPHANDFPAPRTDHCLVVAAAPDNSSYNIYMYGGMNNRDKDLLDDVWILTLPSFQWIKIFEGESPRYGHNCHVAPSGRQMITVGGLGDYYTANFNDSNCDWESKSVALYDLTTLQWSSQYLAHLGDYKLPTEIWQRVGGNESGYANVTGPLDGKWSSSEIKALFVDDTLPPPPGQSPTAAIAGGVIGGLVGVGLIAAAAFYYYRRYIKKVDRPVPPPAEGHQWIKPELEGSGGTTDAFSPKMEAPVVYYEIDDGVKEQIKSPIETKGKEIPLEMP